VGCPADAPQATTAPLRLVHGRGEDAPPGRLSKRDTAIWAEYTAGAPEREIAAGYGISQQRVSQIIARVRERLPVGDVNEVRVRHLAVLWRLHAQLFDHAMDTAADPRVRFAAVDRLLRVQERMARLAGLDVAPVPAGDVEQGGVALRGLLERAGATRQTRA
jgi:DNA-binding CsgD family transcriptional regulator